MLTSADIKTLEGKFATKEDILGFKDEILHEVVAMRQELSIVIGYKDQIEDHEVRINKLESKVQSN